MEDAIMDARGAVRRRVSRLLAVVALVATLIVPGSSASGNPDWRTKVDPNVLSAAALGATEFVIYLQEQADLAGADDVRAKEAKGRFVYEALTATARESQGPVVAELDRRGAWHREFWIVNAVHAKGDLALIQAVAERAEVANVFPVGSGRLDPPADIDAPGGPTSTEAVAAVGPSIDRVGADEVWALGYTGQGVTVAGADTGVRWTHNALKRQYRGWDGATADHNYHWHDAIKNPNTECPAAPPMGASPQPCDDDRFFAGGHGTHTVGTMVGDDGGANQIGMAPGAEWIACRNMNNGLGTVPTYLDCMQWFIAPTDLAGQNPDPAKAPHVVNNSWGCVEGCAPPLLQQPIEASRAAGIVYVVSAGNDGPACSTVAFPLSVYEAAFSVGATNIANDNIASFSSRGPVLTDGSLRRKPDISAPGVGVRSALRASDSSYGSASGTSMAGPHVAGLVALIISANPSLAGDVDRIEEIVEQTAVPRPAGGCGTDTATSVPNNIYGWGRINALDAVKLAQNKAPVAVDDTATTERDVPVTVDVLANDTDPDGDTLTVTQVGQGQNGSTTNNGDGTVTYTPAAGFVGADSFGYSVDDGFGNTDTATVFVSVTAPPKATGGGWLDNNGQKTNFGFNAERTAAGPAGELQLNDRLADVKIHIKDVTFIGPVEGCGRIPGGENSLEFHGTGRYNGAAAGFRVCVQDNGEGSAAGPDLFYLECASGCAYATTDAGADEAIDGGNIQVAHVEAGSEGGGEEAPEPTTMVLDPLLLSEAAAGQALTLTVAVYDQHQEALAGAAVTVTQISGSGATLLQGVTDATGTATILVAAPDAAAEYMATAGSATSNAISIAPLVS